MSGVSKRPQLAVSRDVVPANRSLSLFEVSAALAFVGTAPGIRYQQLVQGAVLAPKSCTDLTELRAVPSAVFAASLFVECVSLLSILLGHWGCGDPCIARRNATP